MFGMYGADGPDESVTTGSITSLPATGADLTSQMLLFSGAVLVIIGIIVLAIMLRRNPS